MRIAIVVNSFPKVSETFIINKVLGLRANGVDVKVIAHEPSQDLGLFSSQFADNKVEFVHYGLLTKQKWFKRYLHLLTKCDHKTISLWRHAINQYGYSKRSIRAFLMALLFTVDDYDIIHFEYSGLAVAYLDVLPLISNKSKLVTSCRGAAEQITPLINHERASLLEKTFSFMDRVHCVSMDMLHTVEQYGLPATKAFINYPSIEIKYFQRNWPYISKGCGPYHLMSVGRLHWKKGFEYALLAVRHLLDRGYNIQYHIIGGGTAEESLRFTIHDLSLQDKVHLHGRQNSEYIQQKLQEADIFLLPSVSEGLSNAVLEAMSMSLPVVSTTAGGMIEAITDGVNGLLVPPRNSEALANKIELLIDNPLLRSALGYAACQTVKQKFSIEKQIEIFLSEYQKLIAT